MIRKPVNPKDISAARRSIAKRLKDARRKRVSRIKVKEELVRSKKTLRKLQAKGEWRIIPPFN